MKRYRIQTVPSLDEKIDLRDVTVNGDSFDRTDYWVTITVEIMGKSRKFFLPREQVRKVEEINEVLQSKNIE